MLNLSPFENLIIMGCGGHARSVADVALSSGIKEILFLDSQAKADETLFGFPVQNTPINTLSENWGYFSASGDNRIREQEVRNIHDKQCPLAKLISDTATIGIDATIEAGCFIGHHAHIGPMAQIGVGCIINTAAIVEHDCLIGDYSHISVNATLCGKVSIGARCFIGAGATIIDGVTICADVIVGAGSIVIQNIEQAGTYVGAPARLLTA